MKKLVPVCVFILLCISSYSCKRDYSCSCRFQTTTGKDTMIFENDMHTTKNGAFHECCDLKAQYWKEQGHADVRCAVPI